MQEADEDQPYEFAWDFAKVLFFNLYIFFPISIIGGVSSSSRGSTIPQGARMHLVTTQSFAFS